MGMSSGYKTNTSSEFGSVSTRNILINSKHSHRNTTTKQVLLHPKYSNKLQNAYLPHLHPHKLHLPLRRHRSPTQPRPHDQNPLPSTNFLHLRVRRQKHTSHILNHRPQAHRTSMHPMPPPIPILQLIPHRPHTNSHSPTCPLASTPWLTRSHLSVR